MYTSMKKKKITSLLRYRILSFIYFLQSFIKVSIFGFNSLYLYIVITVNCTMIVNNTPLEKPQTLLKTFIWKMGKSEDL
jgi:hypothetical protein